MRIVETFFMYSWAVAPAQGGSANCYPDRAFPGWPAGVALRCEDNGRKLLLEVPWLYFLVLCLIAAALWPDAI